MVVVLSQAFTSLNLSSEASIGDQQPADGPGTSIQLMMSQVSTALYNMSVFPGIFAYYHFQFHRITTLLLETRAADFFVSPNSFT